MKEIMESLYKITPKSEEDALALQYPDVPIIYGDFTNWEPKPFHEICELQEKYQPQYDDDYVFNLMKQAGKMGKRLPFPPDHFTSGEKLS